MRLSMMADARGPFVASHAGGVLIDLSIAAPELPRDIVPLLDLAGAVARAVAQADVASHVDPAAANYLPVVPRPGKIICVGLNYREHAAESGFALPDYPALFARFSSSLVGHGQPIVRPRSSEQLDFEGEFAAVIGRAGRHVSRSDALGLVAGYTLFNDASIRDFKMRSSQWTAGKNFDGTGAFGPDFVSADELPPGLQGVQLTTRLNGEVVQQTLADDMVFGIAELVAIISESISLEPGDVIVTGTPSGVGLARKPPLWMRPGDVVTVEADGIGLLSNPVVDEQR